MAPKSVMPSGLGDFLERYNNFHDALLESVEIASGDSFSGNPPVLNVIGKFAATLRFRHYNYRGGHSSGPSVFLVRLSEVGALRLSSSGANVASRHWAVVRVEISPPGGDKEKYRLTVVGEELDKSGKAWKKKKIAQIEFSGLTFSVAQ